MSLRRRIALAAAVSVAAVAVAVSIVGYVSTRSHLLGELKGELRARAAPYLQAHPGRLGAGALEHAPGPRGANGSPDGSPNPGHFAPHVPPAPAFGGAPGYFQFVFPDGTIVAGGGGTPELSVSERALAIATSARGSLYTSTRVHGVHLEVLTVGDPYDHYAVQVALPLTGVDSVLRGLLLPYGLLISGGVLLALLLGTAISRSALSPIEHFVHRTEDVAGELEHPSRLDESGPSELRRLAASFNRTLDALERSIDAQRNLVADASHELRTPIAALRSDIQIFLDSERLPAQERTELQQSIVDELDELAQVVADVVELARGSAPSADREPVELDSLVRDAVKRARRRAPRLAFELDLEPTVVVGSHERIARAAANVIANACKWSPPEGAIEVRLRGATLYVRDHGPGFADRDLPHVFDRFYRAPSARRLPGSGLGLAIVKQTAEAHGGYASAANAADGGALVTVSFGPPTEPTPSERSAGTPARRPARIS